MIRDWLDQWFRRGTFELDLRPLEVAATGEVADFEGLLSRHLQEVVRQVEAVEETLRRERTVSKVAIPKPDTAPAGDAQEMRQFARSILPAMDALDRIIEFGESVDREDEVFQNWLKAVEALRLRLVKALEGIGLTWISSVGMEVDLNVHDVVAVVPAGEFPPNTVVKEQQRGYYFRGKLLRDARVVVAQ